MRHLLVLPMFVCSVVSAAERYDPDNELCRTNMAAIPQHIVEQYKEKYEQRCILKPTPVVKQEIKLKSEPPTVIAPENNPFIDECVSLTMNRLMCYELWVERSK